MLLLLVWPNACSFHIHGDHRRKTARNDASAIGSAATMWLAEHPGGCPTVAALRADGMLDRSKNERDPWGGAYTITCDGEHMTVRTAGRDHVFGTRDDVSG